MQQDLRDARAVWPELTGWFSVGMHDPVFRVHGPAGLEAYVREDDGSSEVLRQLEGTSNMPSPRLLDSRAGWLLLSAVPGVPLHDQRWVERPMEGARIVAEALRCLDQAGVTHGDMCLPNILGDLRTGKLSGIVDWRYTGQFDREIDVASAVWSCGFNGYPSHAGRRVLHLYGWPRANADEVHRLSQVWLDLTGPPESPD